MLFVDVGQDPHTERAAFPMKPAPNQQDFREAIQKLNDPEKRLIDEFFWFWPEEFGNSESDPAMQALAKGDSKTAIEIWSAKEKSPTDGVVASHNLALVYHITALDWEKHSFENEVSEERRQKIVNYWKEAFDRWENLATNERLWEKVTARIRQLKEPNLSAGFAHRMRATLPEALDKINAELAIAFAESDKIELARLHIRFMRETNQGLDNVKKTAELVLTPASNRLKEQIKSARDRGEKNPPEAAKVALELFGQAGQTLTLFDLFFGKDNELRNDLFDEVASVCNRLQIVYYKETGDDKTCLEILKVILPFATSTDLRQVIEKDISETCTRLELLAVNKKLEPIYALLKSIQDSKDAPKKRLERFEREAMPAIIRMTSEITDVTPVDGIKSKPRKIRAGHFGKTPSEEKAYTDLLNSVAIVLRGISLEAWNTHHDKATAIAANRLAWAFACDPPLDQKLQEDQSTLAKFSNPFGDAGGEHTRMNRGQYDSMMYVIFAFVAQVVCSGILALSFITNILKISCDDTGSWIVGVLAGAGIALLVFWDRWKCIEALSSQASCGIANISILYVPIVALMYANWRGIKKVFDYREWENTGANKSSRLALVASAIVLIFGIVGEWRDNGVSNSTSYTPPVHNSPPPQSAPAYTPPAPTTPAYTPPPVSASKNSDGNVYRVPNSVSSTLDNEKAEIELQRITIQTLDAQVEKLGRDIENDRLYLDKTSQYAVDVFNAKVDRYNELAQKDKVATAAFNVKVDNYNAKLRQYGR